MKDLIDRQAAIDILYDFAGCIVDTPNGDYQKAYQAYRHRLEILPSARPEPQWIPVSERLPDEDNWLGGSGRQFSENVLVSVLNSADEDAWVYVSQTIDGEWALELPRHCEIIAWMPLPEPYQAERRKRWMTL